MEIGNGLVKLLCGKLSQHFLEVTKSGPAIPEIPGALHLFQTSCPLHKQEHSPEIMTGVLIVAGASHCSHHVQRFPGRVTSLSLKHLSQIVGNTHHIFH